MFRHQGKARMLSHNKKIASLLSFVAGIVNVAGFLSVQRLTTNVTGHFAFFIDEIFKLHLANGLIFFIYILFFFLGSFTSSLLIEIITRKNERFIYIIPALLESLILYAIALGGQALLQGHADFITYSLLFAMGLQNALVTRISDAMVRTTHLTGLFTDLGIELSQLFFYKIKEQRDKLIATIRLRLRIIIYFFLGGIVSGLLYSHAGLYVLLLPATLLAVGLLYDSIKFKMISWKRKNNSSEKATTNKRFDLAD
ncbi:DUF1275 domain-containing protein [Spirosoma sp. HMF4905]|uniref:DUF1275 domain-containing protein n=1 Tax=Spirosoma arboris TaxID=2682092 RepID=A0A7K1SJ24_9BACT|nr:YoaK family protein [Spirosoma arboris]MVM33821.1 DUF1275 domain-containing protein [Spirosoma arboris]